MDEDRQNQVEDEKTKSVLERDSKKSNKSKFKMVASRIATILAIVKSLLPAIAIFAVVASVLTAAIYLCDLKGHNNMVDVASKDVIDEYLDIAKADDNTYYFKIGHELIDDYLKKINEAYHKGYYFESEPEEDEDLEEYIYDKDNAYITEEKVAQWFKTKNYQPYLIKMIRAEIASSYPKLGDYVGLDGTEDKQGNKKDINGDYVAQGVVEIKRTKMNKDGTTQAPIPLQYLPYTSQVPEEDTKVLAEGEEPKSFMQLLNCNSPKALNYFSFDEGSGIIYYAVYKEEIVTVDGVETEHTYKIKPSTMSYKSVTSMCSMPYNFLFPLLQKSENPEYIMKVIDLLLEDSEVVFMIQDQLSESVYEEQKDQVEQTVVRNYTANIGFEVVGGQIVQDVTWELQDTDISYDFPKGDKDTTITTRYENTANAYLQKARTWCMDFMEKAILEVQNNVSEENYTYTDDEYANLTYEDGDDNANSDNIDDTGTSRTTTNKYLSKEKLVSYGKSISNIYTWNRVTENKEINYQRFLGLWENKLGEYPPDGIFTDEYLFNDNEKGKKVGYFLPEDDEVKYYPVDTIPSDNGQQIDILLGLLRRHDDTIVHEQLMMYFWNKYTRENVYNVNVDEILNLFNTEVMTNIGSGYGTIEINGCKIDREEFISIIEGSKFTTAFKQYAGLIYDICKSHNLNPILCVSVAAQESRYGRKLPSNSPYDYWGLGVYNNSNTGKEFSDMEEAVKYWCSLINKYQTPGNNYYKMIVERSAEFKTVNRKVFWWS